MTETQLQICEDAHNGEQIGELSDFIRRKIRSMIFNVGLKCQLNWREFSNFISHDLIDSLRKIDRFAFDEVMDELYDVIFERQEEDRDSILPRLYHNLLDILLLNADKFSPSLAIHEFAKDLVFILEDFVRKEGPREVVEEVVVREEGEQVSAVSQPHFQVKSEPEESAFDSPESPPVEAQQSEINVSEENVQQDFQSPESPKDCQEGSDHLDESSKNVQHDFQSPSSPADFLGAEDNLQKEQVSGQVDDSAEKGLQCFQSPESPNDDIPMADVSPSTNFENLESPVDVEPSESYPIAEETEEAIQSEDKSEKEKCSSDDVSESPQSPDFLAIEDVLMTDETSEGPKSPAHIINDDLNVFSESIGNVQVKEETVDSPNSQNDLKSQMSEMTFSEENVSTTISEENIPTTIADENVPMTISEENVPVKEETFESPLNTQAAMKHPDLPVLNSPKEMKVEQESKHAVDSFEDVTVEQSINEESENDDLHKNDDLIEQGSINNDDQIENKEND